MNENSRYHTSEMNNLPRKEGHLREWAPLTDILDHLPARYFRGLLPVDLSITCIAALEEYMALGTNVGIVYWYNRVTGQMQRYKTEGMKRITCLKVCNSVEYMLAAGNASGQVNVFRIQKHIESNLKQLMITNSNKTVERYIIRDLHQSAISCCEWSKNGLKLYTGDRQGVVVLTEFDYQNHLSKSIEILNEQMEIIQLSTTQGHLLVCSLFRTVICHWHNRNNGQWHIIPIGAREGDELNTSGGIFLQRNLFDKNILVVCGNNSIGGFNVIEMRTGRIRKSIKFNQNSTKAHRVWEIPILNPKPPPNNDSRNNSVSSSTSSVAAVASAAAAAETSTSSSSSSRIEFQSIYQYNDEHHRSFDNDYSDDDNDDLECNSLKIITHDNHNLYILNADTLQVLAIAKHFRRILDVSVCNREIFILEGNRSIVRLAPMPDKSNRTANIIYNPLLPPPIPLMGNTFIQQQNDCSAASSPSNENNLITKVDAIAIEEADDYAEDVIKAEECFELPPIEPINLAVPIVLATESTGIHDQKQRFDRFREISQMDFDENILHHSSFNYSFLSSQMEEEESSIRRTTTGDVTTSKSKGIVEIGRMCDLSDEDNMTPNGHLWSSNEPSTSSFSLRANQRSDVKANVIEYS